MDAIRLIALDLDGTLLREDKTISSRTRKALRAASEKGVFIVPTTGRYFGAMPQEVRELPYLRYAITINGAQAADVKTDEVIYRAEIGVEKTLAIMDYLDTLPVIYDAYIENDGFITRSMQESVDRFVQDAHYLNMVLNFRKPVDDLKAFILAQGKPIQKTQLFTVDPAVRAEALTELARRFDGLAVTSSFGGNVEINAENANKGAAMLALADYLGLKPSQTMAFGDGLNDVSMLRDAGIGVAMENASEEVKKNADYVTASNMDDGVARAIEKFVL